VNRPQLQPKYLRRHDAREESGTVCSWLIHLMWFTFPEMRRLRVFRSFLGSSSNLVWKAHQTDYSDNRRSSACALAVADHKEWFPADDTPIGYRRRFHIRCDSVESRLSLRICLADAVSGAMCRFERAVWRRVCGLAMSSQWTTRKRGSTVKCAANLPFRIEHAHALL
jgi:hypothetical protein